MRQRLRHVSWRCAGRGPVAQDGVWGPATKAAVIAFQKNIDGLTPDGYVGPHTGYDLMYYGDPWYMGNERNPGYCYQYVPTIR
ncbi:peptidoglycan-binding protein [Streptomyces sp. KL116D]|uniref:peptidoglycan-binding domain-containing protein n=1 Tax=Streptomyces sp. KL116D TaxID=3045152 RepID=UPI003558F917